MVMAYAKTTTTSTDDKELIEIFEAELVDYPFSRRRLYYKLDEYKNVVPGSETDFDYYYSEEGQKNRLVKQENVGNHWISTVFLCIDHGYGGIPLYFETMVLGSDDEPIMRYTTYVEALTGHMIIVFIYRCKTKCLT